VIFNSLISENPINPEFHFEIVGRVLSRLAESSEAILDFDLIVRIRALQTLDFHE